MSGPKNLDDRVQRVEQLVDQIQTIGDPNVRASAVELIQTLLELHGEGLDRIMQHIADSGDAGWVIMDALARDQLVASLLLLYGLHPEGLDVRVRKALVDVHPTLRSHGVDIELLSVSDGLVRVRVERVDGSLNGCVSSIEMLKLTIENAIYASAPDVNSIVIEGLTKLTAGTTFVQLQRSQSKVVAG